MKNLVQMRRNWSWLVALAIFMAALGPILHRGPGSANVAGLSVTALCTADGLKWLNIKTGQIEDGDSGSGQHSAGKSCDCCTGTGPTLVSAPGRLIIQRESGPVLRPPFESHSPQQRVGWLLSSPRAPPLSA